MEDTAKPQKLITELKQNSKGIWYINSLKINAENIEEFNNLLLNASKISKEQI